MSKEYLESVICDTLEQVCDEVKRQLRQGNHVEVKRYMSSPASFLVGSFVDRIPVRGKRKHQLLVGYFQELPQR